MVSFRSVAAFALFCSCVVASSSAASPAKAVVRRSPSPLRRPASPKPAGRSVAMCFWDDAYERCNVYRSYFLSTRVPAPLSPFSAKLVSAAAKDEVCSAHTNRAKCNAAVSDACLWDDGIEGCSFGLGNSFDACPASRVMNFLQCNYFNEKAAKAPSCTASKPCAYDKTRGCHHPTFSKWSAASLKDYGVHLNDGSLAPSNYGCCSSFLTRSKINMRTIGCFDRHTKTECAADTVCKWDAMMQCITADSGEFRAEQEALTAADAPFGAAYKKADAECRTCKTEAACFKKEAPLDAAKLAKYRKPHSEAALDFKKYCSKIVLS